MKILSVLLILLSTSGLFAQEFKGQWIVGSKVLSIKSSSSELNISGDPSLGIYISNKVGVGGMYQFGYIRQKDKSALFNWSAGPFMKYYFLKINEKNFLYTRLKLLYGQVESFQFVNKEQEVVHGNCTTEGIGLGYTTALNKNLSLELEPGIDFRQKNNLTYTDYTFDIRFEYRFGGA